MKQIPLAVAVAALVTNLIAGSGTTEAGHEQPLPAAFSCERIAVIYLHPDEIYVEKQTLNVFTNKRFKLDFELGKFVESEFAIALNRNFEIEVLTSKELDFRPILAYGTSGGTSEIRFRQLDKKMRRMGCCAVLLITSDSRHSNLIGHEDEGVGFLKSQLLHEKAPKVFFDGRLTVRLFAPRQVERSSTSEPQTIYGGRLQELETPPNEWPTNRKHADTFLEKHRSWFSTQLRQSIEAITKQLWLARVG